MATAINYAYRYPFESAVVDTATKPALRLATSLDGSSDDLFFDGKLRQPAVVGNALSILSTIVRTRFYEKLNPVLLDPVVTSGGGMLRFEGFSSCCGVYARVDLSSDAFDAELRGEGTTNVDFNDEMRSALRRLTDRDDAQLQVGGTGVTLRRESDTVIERKVKMPIRWIKGFCEVQAYQPRMIPYFELSPLEARDLFRQFPKGGNSKIATHITRTGRIIRLASRATPGSVKLVGSERVLVLEPLIEHLKSLQIWYDEESETNAWELKFDVGRLFVLISPELNRGFSGEGQMLSRLAGGQWQRAMSGVAEALNWQSQIDTALIGGRIGESEAAVESALAVLGSRGLVGFDVTTSKYFHRVLPFDAEQLETNQPRLVAARELVASNGVRSAETPDESNWLVQGTGVEHFVRLRPTVNRCTCQWFNRYQGNRGPCKHILAAQLVADGEDSPSIRLMEHEI